MALITLEEYTGVVFARRLCHSTSFVRSSTVFPVHANDLRSWDSSFFYIK